MASVNWLKIKNEYINGNISHRDLAKKHGVSYSAARDHAKKEQWTEKRNKQRSKISEKMEQKTAEKLAEQQASHVVNIAMLNYMVAEALEKHLADDLRMRIAEAKDLKAYTGALRDIKDIQGTVGATVTEVDPLSKSLMELAGDLDAD